MLFKITEISAVVCNGSLPLSRPAGELLDWTRILMELKAIPGVPNDDDRGLTPLHHAAERELEDWIDLLIEHRADPNQRCKKDRLPIDHAPFESPARKLLQLHGSQGLSGDNFPGTTRTKSSRPQSASSSNPRWEKKPFAPSNSRPIQGKDLRVCLSEILSVMVREKPPLYVDEVCAAVLVLVGEKDKDWKKLSKVPLSRLQQVREDVKSGKVKDREDLLRRLEKYTEKHWFTVEDIEKQCKPAGILATWVLQIQAVLRGLEDSVPN